jgi:serine/threonine protein kinase
MAALTNALVGDYRLLEFLGAGGMGEVYRAVHRRIGREVAVKVLTQFDPNPTLVERFLNEARIQSGLHHQNIATLYDFLEFQGRPCIIMEYVNGQTLDALIRQGLSLARAAFVFRAVLEAIAYIHHQTIVHRDIKASNIKLTTEGEVKLLDFGIAKSGRSPALTQTGNFIGTLHCLSPEQIQGKPADARSDIWSLGVLLYEMATGKPPFDAATLAGLCDQINKANYLPAAAVNRALPPPVDAIIGRCLKRSPADRYPAVQPLMRDVDRLIATLSAPHVNHVTLAPGERSGRWSALRSYWPAVLSLGAVAGVLSFFFAASEPDKPDRSLAAVTPAGCADLTASAETQRQNLRPVHIDVIGDPAQIYLYRGGQWLGPFRTPCKFRAPMGEKIHYRLERPGFRNKERNFNVEVTNAYADSLCKVEEDCG